MFSREELKNENFNMFSSDSAYIWRHSMEEQHADGVGKASKVVACKDSNAMITLSLKWLCPTLESELFLQCSRALASFQAVSVRFLQGPFHFQEQ